MKYPLTLILIVAIVLRLLNINQSLWLDEGINAVFVKQLGFKDLIFKYSVGDFHPPLFHIVLKAFTALAGFSELSLRIPSVVFGVLTVVATYLIGLRLFDKKTAAVAALLIATSPLAIYYSQEARMYSMAAFFASLSVFFFVSIIKRDGLYNWFGFIASTTLMLYSDYIPYFLIPTYILYLLIFRKKIQTATLKSFFPAFILIFFLLLPWLFVLPEQLQNGLSAASASPAWANVVGSPQVKAIPLTFVKFIIGRISIDDNLIYFLTVGPLCVYFLILFAISILRTNTLRSFLWFYLLCPIFLTYAVSFKIPVYSYFRLIFILPAFYLLLASAVCNLNWTKPTRFMVISILLINIACSSIYFLNPKFQREDWKSAAKYTIENSSDTSLALFESDFTFPPFEYYNNDQVETKGALDSFTPDPQKVRSNIEEYTNGKDKVFLFQYLSQITDPQGYAYNSLIGQGFINKETKNFEGVGFIYVFEK